MKSLFLIVAAVAVFCGRAHAIVHGSDAVHVPSYAYLEIGGSGSSLIGGGSIISDLHIVSSASNIFGYREWHIGVGYNRLSLQTNMTSFAGIPHSEYNALSGANDIGIIFMPFRLDFIPSIQPITLPDSDTRLPMPNEEGTVVGYGSTDPTMIVSPEILQTTFQRVTSHQMCVENYPGTDSLNTFCAFDDNISNVCNGDAGGGFILLVRGSPTLVGVITPGNLCQLAIPKSYVRLSAYRDWIRSVAQV